MKYFILKIGSGICLATVLLIGMALSVQAQVLYEDNGFSDFSTAWNLRVPTGTSATIEANVPTGSKDTKSLHLVDNTKEQTVAVSAVFSTPYTGTATITYDFCFTNAMDGIVAEYSSGLFQLLSSTGQTAFSLNTSKSAGGTAVSRPSWGTGNGAVTENVLLEPQSWYRVTITVPAIGTEDKYTVSIIGLNEGEIRTYNEPYTQIPSFSFTKAGNAVSDYGKIELNSGYGDKPALDTNYTNIKVMEGTTSSAAKP